MTSSKGENRQSGTKNKKPLLSVAKPAVVDPSGGANQGRVQAHNQRLVLTLIRRHGALPKAEIARRSGLSAQTVTILIRNLEANHLLLRGEPQRGKVGQPSIPIKLNPDGAFSLGLKIGRRSADLVLMDFCGTIRSARSRSFAYPHPTDIVDFIEENVPKLIATLPQEIQNRLCGLGIAIPFKMWEWADMLEVPSSELSAWKDFDIASEITKHSGLQVFVQNDATAACSAELILGGGQSYEEFAYFFIGYFIGGGIVLNHAVFPGRSGNAGAMGSIPLALPQQSGTQLLDKASLATLENSLRDAGIDPEIIWESSDKWDELGDLLEQWINDTANYLALAALTCCAIIDFQAIIIDGAFPPHIRTYLREKTEKAFHDQNLKGIQMPKILAGNIGSNARAIGAATMPLANRYLVDQDVLFSNA